MLALLVSQPGPAHFEPLAGLALALEDAGHDVAFATSPSFCPAVEEAGFEAVAAGLDWLESEPERAFPELAATPPRERVGFLFHRVAAGEGAAALAGDLLPLVERRRPHVVVHEAFDFGPPVAAERAGVPWATLGLGAVRPAHELARLVGAGLADLRAEYGLEPDPDLARLWRWLYLDAYPPSLQRTNSPSSEVPVAHPLRPLPYRGGAEEDLRWLHALPARPTVHVSLASVADRAPELLAAVVRGLGWHHVNVVVALGHRLDPATLPRPPANVRLERSLPLAAVLARADALVTDGSNGEVSAALAAGVPMVGIPHAGEQPYNTFRVTACGAGLRLHPGGATPERLAAAVHQVLDDPLYRGNAQRLRREIEALPGPAQAVRLLERLAHHRVPLPAP